MNDFEASYTLEIATKGTESTPPDPERTKDAFSRIGYSLEEAIADLIDNSIDAGARDVLIRLVYDRKGIQRIFIVDNGRGMSEEVLRKAMRFGSTLKHEQTDLGKYGIGLKAASLSQCEQFAVITRANGRVSGRRWSSKSFAEDWLCEKLDTPGCAMLASAPWAGLNLRKSGTIVMWEKLTCLQAGDVERSETINRAIVGLAKHLGLVFHRFLEDAETPFNIHLDSQLANEPESGVTEQVMPLNPFSYPSSGARGYPKDFRISLPGLKPMTLAAHIWPAKSRDPGYTLGGGKVSSRQGFYFYRNNRLIQAGGWNNCRGDDAEPHVSLARVAVDIPLGAEAHFDVMVQKSKVAPPRAFVEAVKASFSGSTKFTDYWAKAVETYRATGLPTETEDFPLVLGNGISPKTREKAKEVLVPEGGKTRKVTFRWVKLDAGTVFELDRERRRINLNELHRKAILGSARRSKNDAEMFKATLFLLVRDYFNHQAMTRPRKEFLDTCNRLLLYCVNG